MQFKYPELLYALFLLLIPIIVHLFQLRKFQKVAFTNVAFLKNVAIQTRKSAQLKKWLTLITRLLLFAALILAFAQPYFSKNNVLNKTQETVIYLDNSFSMQSKGPSGALLKRAIQDIIQHIPEDQDISIVTNTKVFKQSSISAIKNELLALEYSPKQLSYTAALNKSRNLFSNNSNSTKHLIFISDFQNGNDRFEVEIDSLIQMHAIKLKAINTQNVSIDSAYISNATPTKLELAVTVKNSGNAIDNLPISLFNQGNLIAKTSTPVTSKSEVTFSLPANEIINGEIQISDTQLQFDNQLFFNINQVSKVNVLAISEEDVGFLRRIYVDDEFVFSSSALKDLNYNNISDQNLIILNGLNAVPNTLITALKLFTDNGGTLLVIPSSSSALGSYNRFLGPYGLQLGNLVSSEKRITTINYGHSLYNNGVFEKQVTNFQYPRVDTFYNIPSGSSNILAFEDGKPFLTYKNSTFLISASINESNSNFTGSPLIVPTFYNIAKQSFRLPELYYNLGQENQYEVKTNLQKDGVLSLEKDELRFIPRQQTFNDKVIIKTGERPNVAGIYTIMNGEDRLKNISYNYNREESNLIYQDIATDTNLNVDTSITNVFQKLKSDTKINALWKWFVIFALILLIIEMLILKYFK